ncbi:MAG TPA: hypothetical protein VGX25_02115 [Actinophytocola sp.]|uniref:hypothetical protein n=1 Tax=Actinophytocola sp. TaxID=1872138 RepID=UPI002DDD55D2|nr:hypothetical protein [Actinophytocola sp.]HEV2778174.1 hypothetical protein [Actinophytocola sp.]
MTVRFLRTEPTMAFPAGRLLALREGQLHVLAPDGWTRLGGDRPIGATPVSREEAEDWCEREGWDLHLLDQVPTLTG